MKVKKIKLRHIRGWFPHESILPSKIANNNSKLTRAKISDVNMKGSKYIFYFALLIVGCFSISTFFLLFELTFMSSRNTLPSLIWAVPGSLVGLAIGVLVTQKELKDLARNGSVKTDLFFIALVSTFVFIFLPNKITGYFADGQSGFALVSVFYFITLVSVRILLCLKYEKNNQVKIMQKRSWLYNAIPDNTKKSIFQQIREDYYAVNGW